ncbi:MAG: hypothetical protein D6791_17895 [Chloroflexi bacterium]|nr:MAG: hypothetical protein D6791_17895 [Chloroflexota bacterium]
MREFAQRHPYLTAWAVLAVGMVAILFWSARDAGLLPSQMAALVVATVLLAGACVWIISWEDNGENLDAENQRSN